ncbi:MAG: FmdE family protein [Gallionellaceae bacterium]|nr:FmdE family protein [Gallionellaceae bacterium]
MRYPAFFDQTPGITMYDPLAKFLGATEGGIIEYRYVDAVKAAGHSCPTVASAWLMTARALEALYPKDVPERGAISVAFRQDRTSGVTGVIANIVSLVTGATHDTGFKGLAGRFDRRNLLFFNAEVGEEIRFTRKDNGAAVDVTAHLERVPGDPRMRDLMTACIAGHATDEMQREFGHLWQARVSRLLLEHAHDIQVIAVRAV